MPSRTKLTLLVGLHLVSSGLLSLSCWMNGGRYDGIALEYLPSATLLSLAIAQACLLGIWAAFVGASWAVRVGGVIAGVLWLDFLVAIPTVANEYRGMPAVASLVIVVALLAARGGRIELRRVSAPESAPPIAPIRWSVRGLILFTMASGVLIGLARNARDALGNTFPIFLITSVWSLLLAVQALAACWASLGSVPPRRRIVAVVLGSAATGTVFAYGVGAGDDWKTFVYLAMVSALQSAVVAGTLLVLRPAGYRLVRRSPSDAPAEPMPVHDGVAASTG